jgi:hypothetical protein
VSGLGGFSPNGWLFALGSFWTMAEIVRNFRLLFPDV